MRAPTSFLLAIPSALLGAMVALQACDLRDRAAEGVTCASNYDCAWGLVCDESGRCSAQRVADVGLPSDVSFRGSADVSWSEWGTDLAMTPTSVAVDDAMCGIEDVRTDDLAGYTDDYLPGATGMVDPWPDVAGRCGDDVETLAWRLANCERLQRNLEPLSCDLRLVWAGREHATDMRDRAFFSHLSPEGATAFDRLDEVGIPFVWAGENLARYTDIVGAHVSWMRSDAHRMNVLNDQYTHAGVGIVERGAHEIFVTGLFIRP